MTHEKLIRHLMRCEWHENDGISYWPDDAPRKAAEALTTAQAEIEALKARVAELEGALGRAQLQGYSLQQRDITLTFASVDDVRLIRDVAASNRATLGAKP